MNTHTNTTNQQVKGNTAALAADELTRLNQEYAELHFNDRIRRIYKDFDPAKILVTSSFAATSAYFLHIISENAPQQPIHFINTGFHFPETLAYKKYLTELFSLNVIDLHAEDYMHDFSVREKLYETDPDYCCSINKIEPLDAIKSNFDVWVSSLMSWQTDNRADMNIFDVRRGIIKFNPMIDVTQAERDNYIDEHKLPFHPLVAKGFSSIGCVHCTAPGNNRCGRWEGKPKTECGLHL